MGEGWAVRAGLGIGVGAASGTLWWGMVVPSAHSFPILAGSHALAGLAFASLIPLATPRWCGLRSIGLGLASGLVLGPLLVVQPFVAGHLTGLSGFLGIAGVMLLAALVGLELGRRGVSGMVLLVAFSVATVWINQDRLARRDSARPVHAARLVEGFPDQPVAIVGIDGGDFSVIDPMVARGELPHFADLMQRGRRGVFRSTEQSLSPVVWTTILSGHPPESHGLRNWSTSDNRNRRVPMLWDLYGAHDLRSVVVNVPGTWPPADVSEGRILAGFPIPGIVSGGRGQLTGTVLSSVPGEDGSVATHPIEREGPGHFRFDFPIAAPELRPRIEGFWHPLIEAATQDRLLPVAQDRLNGRVEVSSGRVRIESPFFEVAGAAAIEVDAGGWSPWIRIRLSGGSAYVRLFVLEADADRLRMALTPAFQDPVDPRYPFAVDVPTELLAGLSSPYIVEGPGWRAHRDPRVAPLLPTILGEIEQVHAEAALALLHREKPDLFVYTITVTDRIQHPFWRDHEPETYRPDFEVHAELAGEDPVLGAYRLADRLLGRVLAALPSDVLLFVVSDHGVAREAGTDEGGHRQEGIWIAAGPGIEPKSEATSEELSLLDLVPTLLHCVGAPAAHDMPGRVVSSICPGWPEEPRVVSYRNQGDESSAGPRDGGERLIDATREEQLRSLGYIE